jgi:hypothetical protein
MMPWRDYAVTKVEGSLGTTRTTKQERGETRGARIALSDEMNE